MYDVNAISSAACLRLPYRSSCRRSSTRGLLRRLRFAVAYSDWDRRFLAAERSANRVCVWLILLALGLLAPGLWRLCF